jgi:hypothetical protein
MGINIKDKSYGKNGTNYVYIILHFMLNGRDYSWCSSSDKKKVTF